MKPKYFLKAWSVTNQTLKEIEAGCVLLETENNSYTLRQLVALGLKQLENLKRKEA